MHATHMITTRTRQIGAMSVRSTVMRRAMALLALSVAGASFVGAQENSTFNWDGQLAEGRTVYLHNINGAVTFEAGTGNTVQVTAVKRWRRGDGSRVRIEARQVTSGDVVICALWNDNATCDEDGYHGNRGRDRDDNDDDGVSVDFTVRIPAHARVSASTVNGDLRVDGTNADIEAHTVNGDLEAYSTAGLVEAGTVNGSITVRTAANGTEDLQYSTVNGSVTVHIVSDANLDVNLSTVNGSISSDFPMTLDGRINPRRVRATIGNGGPELRVRTVNGSIRLRKQ